jgi:hypothetical protein
MRLFHIQFNQCAGIVVQNYRRSSAMRSTKDGPEVSSGFSDRPRGFRPFQ